MTVIVCFKITYDTSQLRPAAESGAPRLDNAPLRISTFDENALELAVQLKEQFGARIVGLSLLPAAPPRDLVLRALAIGADEVFLIHDPTAHQADALATTTILAAALRKLGPWELLICGDGSIDQYNRQVGPRLAEALSVPSLTQVIKVEYAANQVRVERALEDRIEIVEALLPALITVSPEINQPRIPTVLQIMGASKKPVTDWSLTDLGLAETPTAGLRTLEVSAPPSERKRIAVAGEDAAQIGRSLARILLEAGVVKTT